MAPSKKNQVIEKLSWAWCETTDPNNISLQNVETAYRINLKNCTGACRRNCNTNPMCLYGLGEYRFLNKKEITIDNGIDQAEAVAEIRKEGTFVGLRNLGATCYINSLLQLWFHNSNFRQAIYRWNPELDPEENENFSLNQNNTETYEPKSVIGHLQFLFAMLEFSNRTYIDPTAFVTSLNIDVATQQDLQEFSNLFMSLIEKTSLHQSDAVVKNIVNQQFRGQYSYVTRCNFCKTESRRPSFFYELELNIKDHNTIYDCLSDFLQEEKLENSNKYFCEVCNSKQDAIRSIKLDILPEVLNLQLMRFVYDRRMECKKKINSFVQFPEILNMSTCLEHTATDVISAMEDDSDSGFKDKITIRARKDIPSIYYVLTAVLIHKGSSAYSGHYIAHIRDSESGHWYKFNDENIEPLKEKQLASGNDDFSETTSKKSKAEKVPKGFISSNNAYMLVYKRATENDIRNLKTKEKIVEPKDTPVEENLIKQDVKPKKVKTAKSQTKNNGSKTSQNKEIHQLISDDNLKQSKIPEFLKKLVLRENEKFAQTLANFEELNKISQNTLLAKQSDVRIFYDYARDYTNGYEFIVTDWLSKWINNDRCMTKEIDNSSVLCKHNKLDLNAINSVKCISKIAADYLFQTFGGHLRLTQDSLCWNCVTQKCKILRLKNKIRDDFKNLGQILKQKIEINDGCYWVGKQSLKCWRRLVLEQYSVDDQQAMKSEECLDENSNNNDELQSENVVQSDTSSQKENDKLTFNDDLICEHGNLCVEENDRRLIPQPAWEILYSYFPNAKVFANDSLACNVCEKMLYKNTVARDYYISIAMQQREVLSNLFLEKNRFNLTEYVFVFNDDDDSENSSASEKQNDDVNHNDVELGACGEKQVSDDKNCVAGDSSETVPSDRVKNGGRCTESDEKDEVFYLVSVDFITVWKKFIRNCGKKESLDSLENANLICEHKKLLYYPNSLHSDKFVVVSDREWTILLNFYTNDVDIRVVRNGNNIKVTPDVCKLCAEQNLIYKIVVRKITEDDDEKSNTEHQPKSKKMKLASPVPVTEPSAVPSTAGGQISLGCDDNAVRRSTRRRKVGDNERNLRIDSNATVRDLKLRIMDLFHVAPFDQHLELDGRDVTPLNNSKISELGFYQHCVVTLKVDEPDTEQCILDDIRNARVEEGFKGNLFINLDWKIIQSTRYYVWLSISRGRYRSSKSFGAWDGGHHQGGGGGSPVACGGQGQQQQAGGDCSGAAGAIGSPGGAAGGQQPGGSSSLAHWMSVMAEHMGHHADPTAVGVHYMAWNTAECGQHGKDDYSNWSSRNHMSMNKQGYEAKMNNSDHHTGQSMQKGSSLDEMGGNQHAGLASSSSSPVQGPGASPALLVVPQPINASKMSGALGPAPQRKYQCKMCPQSRGGRRRSVGSVASSWDAEVFGSKADLQLHTQMHMREAKPYKCSQCCKAFANSSYLSQHTRIHLGIKPYRCEICQRKFTQLSHLQQHIRTHTGDKPYKCRHPGCQKAFSQLSNLQSHSRCHQTDKPYKCNSCYKCFSDEPSLLEHIPKHKESKHLKTHICQYCGKSYTQETYLTKHMQKHSERTDKRPPITGLGLNRNLLAAAGSLEPAYWSKLSPDTMSNLDLERIEYQNSVLEQQRNLNSNINNVLEHSQQRNGSNLNSVLDHQRHSNLNSNANSILDRGANENNTVGEDLVVIRQSPGGNNSENGSSNANTGATPTSNYSEVNKNAYEVSISKSVSNSAFTPINSIGHLNNLNLNHHMAARPYIYDALSFQNKQAMDLNLNKSVQNSNGFPNQLISLHQIRNYAHQPTSGLMSEHSILGLKDK